MFADRIKHVRRAALAIACGLLLHPAFAEPAADRAADRADVDHVLAAYHDAVVGGDGDRLAALFLPGGSLWLNVLSDGAYAAARAKAPNLDKVKAGSPGDFARLVASRKGHFNPTHTDMRMNSDGTIASVWFDYVFLVDGKAANRGSETWQLVKGSDGWRIAALTYSSNPVW